MANYNRVILVGNLTRDPELRNAPSGAAIAEMRLAVSETYRDRQTDQNKEIVCYVDVVAWNRQAETCGRFLKKGRQILVEGRLVYDEWKNKQGESRNRLRVRADRVQFMDNPGGVQRDDDREDGAAAQAKPPRAPMDPPPAGAEPPPQPSAADDDGDGTGDDENLPF